MNPGPEIKVYKELQPFSIILLHLDECIKEGWSRCRSRSKRHRDSILRISNSIFSPHGCTTKSILTLHKSNQA